MTIPSKKSHREYCEVLTDQVFESHRLRKKREADAKRISELERELAEAKEERAGFTTRGSDHSSQTSGLEDDDPVFIMARAERNTLGDRHPGHSDELVDTPPAAVGDSTSTCITVRPAQYTPETRWILSIEFQEQIGRILAEAIKIYDFREFARTQQKASGNSGKSSPIRRNLGERLEEICDMVERGERRLWLLIHEAVIQRACAIGHEKTVGISVDKATEESLSPEMQWLCNQKRLPQKPSLPMSTAKAAKIQRLEEEGPPTAAELSKVREVFEDRLAELFDVKVICKVACDNDAREFEENPNAGWEPPQPYRAARTNRGLFDEYILASKHEDRASVLRVNNVWRKNVGLVAKPTWSSWIRDFKRLIGADASNSRGPEAEGFADDLITLQ